MAISAETCHTPPDLIAAKKPRAWRWVCTPYSFRDRRVTVLALTETLVAMIAYLLIAIRYGTTHLLVASLIAPLLLLRTEYSERLSLRWARKPGIRLMPREKECGHFDDTWKDSNVAEAVLRRLLWPFGFVLWMAEGLSMFLLINLCIASYCLGCKILVTFVCFARHPIRTITAIPSNWWGVVACLDSAHPPEAVPGAWLEEDATGSEPTFLCPLGFATRQGLLEIGWLGLSPRVQKIGQTVAFSPGILLSVLYRLSIKGTTLILSPLIFVVARTFRASPEDIKDRAYHTFVRKYSLLVLTILAAKLLLMKVPQVAQFAFKDAVGFWQTARAVPLLRSYFVPDAVPLWQIAMTLNAVLAFIVYWSADYRVAHPRSPYWDHIMRVGQLVRGTLTIYVITCNIYICAYLTNRFPIPDLGSHPFPPFLLLVRSIVSV